MKKKLFGFVLSIALSVSYASSVLAADNYSLPWKGVEITEVTYDEYGWPTVHFIVPSEELMSNAEAENPERKTIPPLTEAPEVGTTLGKILKDCDNLDLTRASSYEEAYATFSIGECAWYAYGRFKEVHDIWLPLTQGMGGIKEWLQNIRLSDEIKVEYSINDVPEQSIAVYIPTEEFRDWPGHAVFVEYVERDENGTPITIYYTEANGTYDINKSKFDPDYDGTVRRKTFDEFKNPYSLELKGYILPNK